MSSGRCLWYHGCMRVVAVAVFLFVVIGFAVLYSLVPIEGMRLRARRTIGTVQSQNPSLDIDTIKQDFVAAKEKQKYVFDSATGVVALETGDDALAVEPSLEASEHLVEVEAGGGSEIDLVALPSEEGGDADTGAVILRKARPTESFDDKNAVDAVVVDTVPEVSVADEQPLPEDAGERAVGGALLSEVHDEE